MTAAPYGYGMEPPFAQPRATNTLGLIGFILGVVGLCITGGILSPVGLVISFVALFRPPRGFAVAGVIVGLVGTCGCSWLGIPLLLVAVGVLSLGAMMGFVSGVISSTAGKEAATAFHIGVIMFGLNAYVGQHGSLPPALSDLDLPAEVLKDGWGGAFSYTPGEDGKSFKLSSPGADGTPGSKDDLDLTGVVGPGNQVTIKEARSTRSGKMTVRSTKTDGSSGEADADADAAEDADGAGAPAERSAPPTR